MAVSPRPSDIAGTLLNNNITALNTSIGVVSSAPQKAAMQAELDQLQRELIYHYLDTNRLTAANILSTMT